MKIETFIHRAINISGKISPSAFIAAHRSFLAGFPSTLKVLMLLDRGKLFPTPALAEILTALPREADPQRKTVERIDKKTGEVRLVSQAAVEKQKDKLGRKYAIFAFEKAEIGGLTLNDEVQQADTYQDAFNKAQQKCCISVDREVVRCLIVGLDGTSTVVDREMIFRAKKV